MQKPYVLVADDESGVRSTIVHFLKDRYDCEFTEADNGEEAIEFLKKHHYDLMILDIKMPKKSGIAVIKEAKAMYPDIDIIVMSAWVSDEVSQEAIENGATDYLVKPMDLKVVGMKFSDILKKKGYSVNKT